MATTMTTAENILKEVYEDQLRDQLQSETVTLLRIERTSEGVTQDATGGKYTTFPVRVKRNHGIGARGEMEALPKPKTQGYLSARVMLKYLYGAIQLSGQAFKLATTNRQAFASALDLEVDGMREGLKKDTNRQVYGNGTGVLATSTSAGSTTTFLTDNAQYLEEGMIVDVYDDEGSITSSGSEREIESLSESGGTTTVTFSSTVGETIGSDYELVRHGSRDKEKTGFDAILNPSGDFDELYNIEHDIWTGNVTAVDGAITEGAMIAMVNKIRRRGGDVTVGFTTHGVQTSYFNLLSQLRRFTNTTEFAGGYTGLAFTVGNKDIPIVADWDCQPERLYFMNEKEIKLYQDDEWSWMDRDGSRWTLVTDSDGDYDAYKARLFKYCELGTHRRNSHGLLTGVTETES